MLLINQERSCTKHPISSLFSHTPFFFAILVSSRATPFFQSPRSYESLKGISAHYPLFLSCQQVPSFLLLLTPISSPKSNIYSFCLCFLKHCFSHFTSYLQNLPNFYCIESKFKCSRVSKALLFPMQQVLFLIRPKHPLSAPGKVFPSGSLQSAYSFLCLYYHSQLSPNHSFYPPKPHHYFKVQLKDQFL